MLLRSGDLKRQKEDTFIFYAQLSIGDTIIKQKTHILQVVQGASYCTFGVRSKHTVNVIYYILRVRN
jgi:hypothetical protein